MSTWPEPCRRCRFSRSMDQAAIFPPLDKTTAPQSQLCEGGVSPGLGSPSCVCRRTEPRTSYNPRQRTWVRFPGARFPVLLREQGFTSCSCSSARARFPWAWFPPPARVGGADLARGSDSSGDFPVVFVSEGWVPSSPPCVWTGQRFTVDSCSSARARFPRARL